VTDSANIETVRRVYEQFARRREPQARDEVAELWHTSARFYPLLVGEGALEGAVYDGHEGLRTFLGDRADRGWSELSADVLELRELDDSRVLAHVRTRAVGEASGARVEADTWHLWTVQAGKVAEGRVFADEAEALAHDPAAAPGTA
jgi:ketosteroid isomerase-like protein